MWQPRDPERAMYVYKQRKEKKRTFADIGRELGITGARVRDMYRQLDWKLNGYNADHHKNDTRSQMGKIIPFPTKSEL